MSSARPVTAQTLLARPVVAARLAVALESPRATDVEPSAPALVTATVVSAQPGLELELPAGRLPARRAKSCLVPPEAGDRVLATFDGETLYVLAVLGGAGTTGPTRVAADAGLRLEAAAGRIVLCAGEGVDLLGRRDVRVTTGQLEVQAQEGTFAIEELGFFGRTLRAHVTRASLVAEDLDQVLTRFTQRAKRAYRFVAELDQLRAGSIDVRAETVASIRAENTLMTARVLAKIDGEQVHIG